MSDVLVDLLPVIVGAAVVPLYPIIVMTVSFIFWLRFSYKGTTGLLR